MGVKTEGMHRGEFLVSEANGSRSRETVTIASGQVLEAGAVLGKVTASGEYTAYAPGATDGSEAAAAVLYDAVDTGEGTKEAVVVARDAEVNATELVWPSGATQTHIDNGTANLAANGIIAR
ncbi:head decoration protein [Arhodomonas sp. AD133]|uniref:head decoration protein n=1 Tax=Arhodomonas sp. AD133 TaxID=3415009 RepID=UPI003EB8D88D